VTSYVSFPYASVSVDDIIALIADIAGRALSLGRPAALSREQFVKHYDNHYSGENPRADWPAWATYAGDGAALTVDVDIIPDSGNPHDGWAYSVKVVLTLPQSRGGRVTLDVSTSSWQHCQIMLVIEDDRDGSLFDAAHELSRARAGANSQDDSKRAR
jgi:hypothetical protein